MIRVIATALCCVISTLAFGIGPSSRYLLDDQSSLILRLPDGWVHAPDAKSAVDIFTVVIKPSSVGDFEIRATPLLIPCEPCATHEPTLEAIAKQAAALADQEADHQLTRVESSHLRGYYFTLQQPYAGADDYRFLTYGIFGFDGIRLSFTVLSNQASTSTIIEAINALKNTRRLFIGTRPSDMRI